MLIPSCTIDYYRGWTKHWAVTGCTVCRNKIREYNREAKRRQRAGAPVRPHPRAYSEALRAAVLQDAVRIGARRTAEAHSVAVRTVYDWCRAEGIRPAPRGQRTA